MTLIIKKRPQISYPHQFAEWISQNEKTVKDFLSEKGIYSLYCSHEKPAYTFTPEAALFCTRPPAWIDLCCENREVDVAKYIAIMTQLWGTFKEHNKDVDLILKLV
jgi:hypothetical protein